MNLLYCINQHYLQPFMVSLGSLKRFAPQNHVYILHRDLDALVQEQIKSSFPQMDFHFYKIMAEDLPYLPTTRRYPLEIYFRLYAACFLPEKLERILYLDADTLIINPLDQLYQTPFKENYFAGCTHTPHWLRRLNALRLGTSQDIPYINTGVLLMNLTQLRQLPIAAKIACFMQKKRHLWLPDQDILFALYGRQVLQVDAFRYNLSERLLTAYNLTHLHKRSLAWAAQHTAIIHYCSKRKPWHEHYHGMLDYFYLQYINGSIQAFNELHQ